jgi:hypothetical protein
MHGEVVGGGMQNDQHLSRRLPQIDAEFWVFGKQGDLEGHRAGAMNQPLSSVVQTA